MNLDGWWRARSPRERRALILGLVVCAVAASVQLIWSALAARERLVPAVARLEGAAALARTVAAELEEGRTRGVPGSAAGAPGALPPLAGLAVEGIAAGRYRARGTVAFDAWLAWTGQLLQEARLTLVSASLVTAGEGRVRVDAELEAAR